MPVLEIIAHFEEEVGLGALGFGVSGFRVWGLRVLGFGVSVFRVLGFKV